VSLSFDPPSSNGRDPITAYLAEAYGAATKNFTLDPTTRSTTLYFDQILSPDYYLKIKLYSINGVGMRNYGYKSIKTLDIPRNSTEPWIDHVTNDMIRFRWTDTNPNI
jgi:hypothetical protein